MARSTNFPHVIKTDGATPIGNGLEGLRRTAIVRVQGPAASYPVLTLDGNPFVLAVNEQVTYMAFRLLHGLVLATAGVVKLAQASNADATAANAIAAVLRTNDTTPLAAATAFAAEASGYALIGATAAPAAVAGALLLTGRDAAGAGTANINISAISTAPQNKQGTPTALVICEIYTIFRKTPPKIGEIDLADDDAVLLTRVFKQAA